MDREEYENVQKWIAERDALALRLAEATEIIRGIETNPSKALWVNTAARKFLRPAASAPAVCCCPTAGHNRFCPRHGTDCASKE